MKITQKRKVNRYMSFFRNNFGFHTPYQILIDGPFCLAALEGQVRVGEQLSKYFQCELKLLTTSCVILEMEKLGPMVSGALRICKQFAIHRCGHEKMPIPASKCLESMIYHENQNNPDRYIIATQDAALRGVARQIPGTPILYLYFRSPTLEKPSYASLHTAGQNIDARSHGQDKAMERLQKIKQNELGESSTQTRPSIKRKRAKGPNPLSCKKKKKKVTNSKDGALVTSSNQTADGAKKKKRKRAKISKHIRMELEKKSSHPSDKTTI